MWHRKLVKLPHWMKIPWKHITFPSELISRKNRGLFSMKWNLMNPICVSGKNYQEAGPQVGVLQVQTPYASPHQTYQAFRTWRWQKTQGSNDSILKFEKIFFQIWIFGRRFLLVFMVVLLWKKYNPRHAVLKSYQSLRSLLKFQKKIRVQFVSGVFKSTL